MDLVFKLLDNAITFGYLVLLALNQQFDLLFDSDMFSIFILQFLEQLLEQSILLLVVQTEPYKLHNIDTPQELLHHGGNHSEILSNVSLKRPIRKVKLRVELPHLLTHHLEGVLHISEQFSLFLIV